MKKYKTVSLLFVLMFCLIFPPPAISAGEGGERKKIVTRTDLDFGDAPETGDLFFSYPTTLAYNGAAHIINPGIFLGYHIDGEPDGQPSPGANGDDAGLIYPSAYDDEDGVTLPASAAAGSVVMVNVVASVNGYLDAWMDFDLDNTWYAPDEHIFSLKPLNAGNNTLTFIVPAISAPGQSYLRFRFRNYNIPISFDGIANNGEVEDYTMMITENVIDGWDFGDAPEGDGTHFYPTLLSSNGAQHYFVPGIHLGTFADVEPDGQPNTGATGDDTDLLYPSLGDDEDGVSLPASVTPGSIVTITVNASVSGYLDAWMDFSRNGSWNNTDEHIFTVQPIYGGMNPLTFTVPTSAIPGQSYLRFRFRDYDSALSFDGMADNGEVEDYCIEILNVPTEGWDFGDAPDGSAAGMFPTLLSSNGARHVIVPGIYLGSKVDAEPNGQPDAEAVGDDVDALYPSLGDDEDGVIFTSLLATGKAASVNVTASTNGFLDAWMDFNGDGTWSSAKEHIFTSQAVAGGTNNLSFYIPASSVPGVSYARFRFRTSGLPLTYYGLAENGEVEDYKIIITDGSLPLMDFGDAPESPDLFFTFPTTLALNGAAHIIRPGIYLGNSVDGEPDGQPSQDANGDDNDLVYPSSGDDEDGVILPASVEIGSTVSISIAASVAGYVDAWMDFDLDNTWLKPDEHIFVIQPLAPGINTLTFIVPDSAAQGQSYLRFRFRDYYSPISFDGIAYNGEVEDYTIEITGNTTTGWDFGDAPDGPYPTLLANNGARHLVDGITFLGNSIDIEPDGIQSSTANGDDLDNQDDEDGIHFISTILCGNIASVEVYASVGGYLNAWMDFDKNGSWADAGEQIFTDTWLIAGSNTLTFPVPTTASTGNTFARFRFSTQGGLTFTGIAENGEVEDYQVFIYPNWTFTQTLYTHVITIPAGLPTLQSGDLLGVFFINNLGEEQCGGVVEVDANQMNMLFAFGDDFITPDIKEGFEEGELLRWKSFSIATGIVQNVDVVYDPFMPNSDGKFYSNGFSALTDLIIPQIQNLAIPVGWSGISTYIVPADTNVEVMFNPIMGELIILKNLTDIYWPVEEVFTLTTWDAHSGYIIKVSDNAALPVNGHQVMDKIVNLNQGWNLIPVLSSTAYNIESLFVGVEGFVVAKDVAGVGIYWKDYGINTIGEVQTGKAYYVRMNAPGMIDYSLPQDKTALGNPVNIQLLSTPWNIVVSTSASHLIAFNVTNIPLQSGDIVGGFTADGWCTGAVEITDPSMPFALSLNGDDIYSSEKDGFESGELIIYKLYRPSMGETFDLPVTYDPELDHSGLFVINGLSAITDVKITSTSITNPSQKGLRIYPNPTNGTFTIEGIHEKINVRIYNAFGGEVYHSELNLPAKVDLSSQPKGIYFIKVETDNSTFFKKLVIN